MQNFTDHSGQVVVIAFRGAHAGSGLTGRDRLELHRWAAEGRRVEVEDGFATIYRDDEPWAAWGVGRDGGWLLLWDCVTHADIGRFATMPEALATLREGPVARPAPASAHVIPFRRIAPAA